MKKLLYFIIAITAVSCGSNQKSATSSTAKPLTTDTTGKTESTEKKSAKDSVKWEYSEEEDKMTSKKKYFASIDANELLEFKFPYNGGSTATLTIRNQDGENNAMLIISKGQFISNVVDGTTIKVRFDEAQPLKFSCASPSDGSSNILFITATKKLISKLKTSKKIIMQAEFYDEGFKEMEFDVNGFTWNH